ncbi:hypothetical protein Q5752_003368 [Cryptotrichosporon argae]
MANPRHWNAPAQHAHAQDRPTRVRPSHGAIGAGSRSGPSSTATAATEMRPPPLPSRPPAPRAHPYDPSSPFARQLLVPQVYQQPAAPAPPPSRQRNYQPFPNNWRLHPSGLGPSDSAPRLPILTVAPGGHSHLHAGAADAHAYGAALPDNAPFPFLPFPQYDFEPFQSAPPDLYAEQVAAGAAGQAVSTQTAYAPMYVDHDRGRDDAVGADPDGRSMAIASIGGESGGESEAYKRPSGDASTQRGTSTTSGGSHGVKSEPEAADVGEGGATAAAAGVATATRDSRSPDAEDHRRRKRNRTIRSCVICHIHKRKCDRGRPCGRCTALGLTGNCVYEVGPGVDPNAAPRSEADVLRERVAELETVVRNLRQKNATPVPAAGAPIAYDVKESRRTVMDRQKKYRLGEAALAHAHAAKNDGPRTDGEAGPYENHVAPNDQFHPDPDSIGQPIYIGAPAGKTMLRQLREMATQADNADEDYLEASEEQAFRGWLPNRASTYPFTTIWNNETFPDEYLITLPDVATSEIILQAFIDEITVMWSAFHLPTLVDNYRTFMAAPLHVKRMWPHGKMALVIMVVSLGTMVRASATEIFGDPDRQRAIERQARGEPKVDYSNDFTCSRTAGEIHLAAAFQVMRTASYLSAPNLDIIQAELLIAVYFLNAERAADGWSWLGCVLRHSVALGYHIDPMYHDAQMSELDAEVLRRMWWGAVNLDCLYCVSFGRPSNVTFYNTQMPLDKVDEELSRTRGSDAANRASAEAGIRAIRFSQDVSEQTYHAATYQLSYPSLELLERVFHVEKGYSRDRARGVFAPLPQPPTAARPDKTYDEVLQLSQDIFDWYDQMPREMRFVPEEDTPDAFKAARSPRLVNQALAMYAKTFILVLILNRPYLRADPAANPESGKMCARAAHGLLAAHKTMSLTGASIAWSWWTMSYRAFHAGTVAAFMTLREPTSELANTCLDDLRGAITVFKDRQAGWEKAHPAQHDLCQGLLRLERLVDAALHQADDPHAYRRGPGELDGSGIGPGSAGRDERYDRRASTPLSEMRAFPPPSPGKQGIPVDAYYGVPEDEVAGFSGAGFPGLETGTLVDAWADMFNVHLPPAGQDDYTVRIR